MLWRPVAVRAGKARRDAVMSSVYLGLAFRAPHYCQEF
jgi:hypothetical protein